MATVDDINDPPLVELPVGAPLAPREMQLSSATQAADLLLVIGWVAASDWLLYRSGTDTAWGAFLVLGALMLVAAKSSLGAKWLSLSVFILLTICSLRLVWCGSG